MEAHKDRQHVLAVLETAELLQTGLTQFVTQVPLKPGHVRQRVR
jgi:hypothetical protein